MVNNLSLYRFLIRLEANLAFSLFNVDNESWRKRIIEKETLTIPFLRPVVDFHFACRQNTDKNRDFKICLYEYIR